MLCYSFLALFPALALTREVVFPPVSGYSTDQAILGGYNDADISHSRFVGLATYANLPYSHCLAAEGETVEKFDIAILGAPFDTGVTARPGARFGPQGIRQGSRRISPRDGYSIYTGMSCGKFHYARFRKTIIHEGNCENVFTEWAKIVDCGDAPLTFLDNTIALKQLDQAHKVVPSRKTNSSEYTTPRIVTLGGDHTTTLSALRSTYEHWGPVSVIHFDSHIDTWDPETLGGGISHYAGVNHGTFLHIAHEEGLIQNTSIHAGIRAPVIRPKGDLRNDLRCGFEMIKARDLDRMGLNSVIEKLRKRVSGTKVYISVDIDVLDPAFAPATGTAEVGGWSTRELLTILDGLEGIEVVGADVVEVAPVYDNAGETTVLAAAEVVHSLLTLMVKKPVQSSA